MNIPSIPGIVDLVALQNAIALVLLSDSRLDAIPILTEIKLHMDSELLVDTLWTLPRGAIQVKPGTVDLFQVVVDSSDQTTPSGKLGAGLLVEMPTARTVSRGVTGPPLSWELRVVAFEDRNVNLSADVGTFIMAEQLAQLAIDILQLQYIFPFGSLMASASAVGPARDWEALKPNINCWGATVSVENGRVQTVRSVNPSITFVGGNCSIICPDAGATVLFTVDGTLAVKANPSAQLYALPFPVASGTVVQAGTWKSGTLLSSIVGAKAP